MRSSRIISRIGVAFLNPFGRILFQGGVSEVSLADPHTRRLLAVGGRGGGGADGGGGARKAAMNKGAGMVSGHSGDNVAVGDAVKWLDELELDEKAGPDYSFFEEEDDQWDEMEVRPLHLGTRLAGLPTCFPPTASPPASSAVPTAPLHHASTPPSIKNPPSPIPSSTVLRPPPQSSPHLPLLFARRLTCQQTSNHRTPHQQPLCQAGS